MSDPVNPHGKIPHTGKLPDTRTSSKGNVPQEFIETTDLIQLSTGWNEENSANVMARSRVLSSEMGLEDKVTEGKGSPHTATKTDIKFAQIISKNKGYATRVAPRLPPQTTLLAHKTAPAA